MRFFSTRVHGALDYLLGIVAIAAPWILGFSAGGWETWVPVLLGATIIVYSLATDYELAVVRRIQIPVHLWFDGLAGVLLVVSPWLFDFDDLVWVPHVVLGAVLALVAFLSNTIPSYERRAAGSRAG